jgi:type IV secretory pathway VirB10-like protein
MKNKKSFGEEVALSMQNLLNDTNFKKIFAANTEVKMPEISAEEKAFVRIASKKCEECNCVNCECEDKNDKKAKALQYIINNITKTSEALDNLGLSKSAIFAIKLADNILDELSNETFDDSDTLSELNERIEDLPENNFSDITTEEEPTEELDELEFGDLGDFDLLNAKDKSSKKDKEDKEDKEEDEDEDKKDKDEDKKDKDEDKDDKDEDEDEDEDKDSDDKEDEEDEDDCSYCYDMAVNNQEVVAKFLNLEKWIKNS